jgi:hypothetical protein
MIGKLAEPNLTRRRYWALPRLHASPQPHILCATLLTPLCGRNSETPPVRRICAMC